MVRADVTTLFGAVDAERDARGVSWDDVTDDLSELVPFNPDMIKRLRNGGRIEVNNLLLLCAWVNRPVSDFLHLTDS